MAELYEELKNRVSQFNMHVEPRRPVMDQEYTYKQRFILQVRWGPRDVCSHPFSSPAAMEEKVPCLLSDANQALRDLRPMMIPLRWGRA